jgi:hypothetical protein
MPALATHVGWLLALCAASVAVAAVAPGVDGWANVAGMAIGLVLLAEFVAGVAWLASRLVRRELSERAQMRWLVGAWGVLAALVVWGRPW